VLADVAGEIETEIPPDVCCEEQNAASECLSAEPIVDALVCELTQVILSLRRRREGAIGEHGMDAGVKVDMAFPGP
jgi:hypothetical protein